MDEPHRWTDHPHLSGPKVMCSEAGRVNPLLQLSPQSPIDKGTDRMQQPKLKMQDRGPDEPDADPRISRVGWGTKEKEATKGNPGG